MEAISSDMWSKRFFFSNLGDKVSQDGSDVLFKYRTYGLWMISKKSEQVFKKNSLLFKNESGKSLQHLVHQLIVL